MLNSTIERNRLSIIETSDISIVFVCVSAIN